MLRETEGRNKSRSNLIRTRKIILAGVMVLLIFSLSNASAINIGVEDFYIDIKVVDFFNQLGVDISAQSGADTAAKFDKGYILTPVKDVKPGQQFEGVVRDAGKLGKSGRPAGSEKRQ